MELAGKQVVVVGLARSGIAAAEFLVRRGARVVATDRRPAHELQAEAVTLAERGVRLALGGHGRETFTAADLVVVSPGVPWDLPELAAARRAGVPVMAELELGFRHMPGRVAAITGTKGKSTTTAALGAILREAGRDVRVGGNIGDAATGLLDGTGEATVFVLEVSSFQLEGTRQFRPDVAVFLNLSPDHLDRHASFEEYARAKARIFANQTERDWAVVNADDKTNDPPAPAADATAGFRCTRVIGYSQVGQSHGGWFVAEGIFESIVGNDRWELALVGRNLTDKTTVSYAGDTPLAFRLFSARSYYGFVDPPRSIAVEGRVRF